MNSRTKKTIFFHWSLVPIMNFVLAKSLQGRPVRLSHIIFHGKHLSKDELKNNKKITAELLPKAEKDLGENFVRISEIFYKLSLLIQYNLIDPNFLQEVFFSKEHLEKVA